MCNKIVFIAGTDDLGREVLSPLSDLGNDVKGFLVEEGFKTYSAAGLRVVPDPAVWEGASHIAHAIGESENDCQKMLQAGACRSCIQLSTLGLEFLLVKERWLME